MIELRVKISTGAVAMIFLCSFYAQAVGFCQGPQTVSDEQSLRLICFELWDDLIDSGFENVSVFNDGTRRIHIFYENRIYRDQVTALGKVLVIASRYGRAFDEWIISMKRLDLIILTLRLKADALYAAMNAGARKDDLARLFNFHTTSYPDSLGKQIRVTNLSVRRFDLVVQPIFDVQFGNRADPYKFKIDFDVGIAGLLYRGLTFEMSFNLPVLDEISTFHKESVRLYSASANYLMKLDDNFFLASNFGYFSGERYGLSTQLARYFRNNDFGLIARADYTGFLFYEDRKWFYSRPNLITYSVGGFWQFSRYSFRASMSYGKFLLKDHGIRVSFGRYIRESRLDLFAISTTGDRWVGVELGIPLFPNKRLRPRRFRLNIPKFYKVKYDYITTDFGKSFTVEHDLFELYSDLSRNYFLNRLETLSSYFLKNLRP